MSNKDNLLIYLYTNKKNKMTAKRSLRTRDPIVTRDVAPSSSSSSSSRNLAGHLGRGWRLHARSSLTFSSTAAVRSHFTASRNSDNYTISAVKMSCSTGGLHFVRAVLFLLTIAACSVRGMQLFEQLKAVSSHYHQFHQYHHLFAQNSVTSRIVN